MTPIQKCSWILIALLGASGAMAQQRLGGVPADKLTDAQKKVIEDVKVGPRTELFSPLLPMLRSPELAYTAERFGEYVYYKNEFDKPIYELIVLLLGRHTSQQFEWRVHYPLAIKAGVKQADVDAIAAGKKPKTLTEDQQIAYDFVTEVLKTSAVGDRNYDRFVKKFGERAVVDTVGILGYYYTIALMLSVDRTPVKDSPVPLLKPLRNPLP